MICKKCGADNVNTAETCWACGSVLKTAEDDLPQEEVETEELATPTDAVADEESSEESLAETVTKKSVLKKWWFWTIIGVLLAGITVGLVLYLNKPSSGPVAGGYIAPPENSYITTVKNATNSNYGITYGAAFNKFFSNPKWSYFKASSGEDVVEFEGDFYYDGAPATATVQFVVDTYNGTLEVYHLSINGVSQSKLMLATLVKKVFESYY